MFSSLSSGVDHTVELLVVSVNQQDKPTRRWKLHTEGRVSSSTDEVKDRSVRPFFPLSFITSRVGKGNSRIGSVTYVIKVSVE